ncbi:Lipid A core - O-antigen ligase and related enzymes [Serratia fonticola]|uniref:Lipid A core - O-antigen ligase and related enzymes n=1 Tax=Serratia fonticola TaxID=47917 RepID=A0A4U9WK40_SERFO|nr:Lipid A core - O-antigen ligase and related enzymes [Serratia fonticola]
MDEPDGDSQFGSMPFGVNVLILLAMAAGRRRDINGIALVEQRYGRVQRHCLSDDGIRPGAGILFCPITIPLYPAMRTWVMQGCLLLTVAQAGLGIAQYYLFIADNFMGYNTLLNRPYGIFQQWNVMASFMATGLALALYLWMPKIGMRRSHWVQWAAAMMLVMAPLLLVLIGSRIGLLAALLVTPLQLWVLWRLDRHRCVLAIGLIGLGVIFALLSQWHDGAARDVTQGSTLSYRLQVWQICLAMIADKPWLGWGYGLFSAEFIHYAHRILPATQESFQMAHPHNELLFWGVEGGLVWAGGGGVNRGWRDSVIRQADPVQTWLAGAVKSVPLAINGPDCAAYASRVATLSVGPARHHAVIDPEGMRRTAFSAYPKTRRSRFALGAGERGAVLPDLSAQWAVCQPGDYRRRA